MGCLKPLFTAHFLLVFLLYNPIFASPDNNINTCQEDDYIALRALYLATDGDNWTNNSGWPNAAFFEANPTLPNGMNLYWHGVTLNDDGCVMRVNLYNKNLNGVIPPEIGGLSNLEFLWLWNNDLSGQLPTEIGNLTALQDLHLGGCKLTGEIPNSIGNLTNLTRLLLHDNQFSGNIPEEIGSCTNLVDFHLNNNQFSGSIPASIGNLVNLRIIRFEDNQFTGLPSSISNLDTLAVLSLADNQLSGSIPDAVYQLKELTSLDLNNNQLTGSLSSSIENLSQLTHVNFSNNQLTDSLPVAFANLPNIQKIEIQNNQLSGCYPPALLGLCSRLNENYNSLNQYISDGNNFGVEWENLCGHVPGASCATPCMFDDYIALRAFYFSTNGEVWADGNDNWPNADFFNAHPTLPVGVAFDDWAGIVINDGGCVEEIRFFSSAISGFLPPEIENLNHLKILRITNSQIDEIPDEIGNISTLETIELRNNMIDNIPAGIGNLNNLIDLNLNYNQIENLPPEIGNATSLTRLYLRDNQISGSLTPELGNLSSLTHLDIRNNQFSGCFDDNLLALCGQFPDDFEAWNLIHGGNDFYAQWDTFCESNEQSCIECRENNYTALRALYLATDGDNWTNRTNWPNAAFFMANPSLPPEITFDDWFGVYGPQFSNGCVNGLNLQNNNLNGFIPPEIGNLTELINLRLYNNQLSGSIPQELTSLTKLQLIQIDNNQLSGNLPAFGNLTDLTELRLNDNLISGAIPASISNLSSLELLDMENNLLDEPLPPELFSLPLIERIYLNNNQITGSIPSEVGNPVIYSLELANNQLTGNIPPEIGNLSVYELDVSYNQLSGNIPPEIGNMSAQLITLNNNQLTGNIPPEIGNVTYARYIHLYDNQLTGSIPGSIGGLTYLISLKLENNQLSGCFDNLLSTLCDQLNIVTVDPGNNFDAFWSSFCSSGEGACANPTTCQADDYVALRALYLDTDGDNWTDRTNWPNANFFNDNPTPPNNIDFSDWYGVTADGNGCVIKLEYIANNLDGTIPPEIAQMYYLNEFYIASNFIEGNIPDEFADMSNLEILRVERCQLTGNIPLSITNLENLVILNLKYNELEGSIPPEIANMSALVDIHFAGNNLSGNIPHEMGNMSNLVGLALYENQLTGFIPSSFENLSSLIYLNLADNQLTGTIPGGIGNIPELDDVDLSNNNLSGCFDENLTIFCDLPLVDFWVDSGNNFDPTWEDFCNTQVGTCAPCRESDYTVLRALYLSTDGDNWDDNTGWPDAAFFDTNPTFPAGLDFSTWEGVTTDEGGCVIELNFRDNNLTGVIPLEIGNLTQIYRLNLGKNQLTGTIPEEIGNLSNSNLWALYLHENELSGTIPASIGNLTGLTDLKLYSNQLTGTIIPEIGNLIELRLLYLSYNQLTGDMPPFLANLPELSDLSIGHNQLSGCYELNLLPLCESLIYSADIDGMNIPVSVGNNFDATWENFCENGAGSCPMMLLQGDYTALNELYLATNGDNWSNNLNWPDEQYFLDNPTLPEGTDVGTWQGVTTDENGYVTGLDLSNLSLMGNIPPEIGNLVNLVRLDLSDNQLMGGIPPEIGDLKTDMNVDASGIPQTISDLTHLEYLNLSNNLLTGTIPTEIGNLTNLTELYLDSNEFSGCYEENLSDLCTQLESYDIDTGNNFDATWENFCNSGTGTCTISVIDALGAGIKVYPSPADDFVIFETDFSANQVEITLYDVHSRRIITQILPPNNQVDIRDLSAGIYFYQLHIQEKLFGGKILIE